MRRLYLVRREMEHYIGPLPIGKLITSYQRMEFGTSDEVSGNLGPWIKFDNQEKLRKYYPEIAGFFYSDTETGWEKIPADGQKKKKQKPKQLQSSRETYYEPGSRFSFFKFLFITLLLGVIGVGGFYGYKFYEKKNKQTTSFDAELFARHKAAVEDIYYNEGLFFLQGYIEKNKSLLIQFAISNKEAYNFLIPYLRYYAFINNGEIEGFNTNYIRGSQDSSAPENCSERFFREQWVIFKPELMQNMSYSAATQNFIFMLLAWDKSWVARRQDRYWIEPQNYYQGCLQVAQSSFQSVFAAELAAQSNTQLALIGQRLKHLNGLLDRAEVISQTSSNPLLFLSCIEISNTVDDVKACQKTFAGDPSWQQLLKQRVVLRLLTLAMTSNGPESVKAINSLKGSTTKLKNRDSLTGLDFSAERYALQQVMSNINPDLIIKKLSQAHPTVVFK